jgi:hypothetical protein
MNIAQAAPRNSRTRVSSENAWPLRGVDGLTFAERAARRIEARRVETANAGSMRSTKAGSEGRAQTTRPYSSPIPIRKAKVR